MQYIKKEVSREQVKELHDRFGCDPLSASVFVRRGITNGHDIMFYLEQDMRYLHTPFLMSSMEDAVDRILTAKDEGEKVLIFGDRDVDGITSTVLLYECLSRMGIDVSWKLPSGNDAYGLSTQTVDEFLTQYGSLIITVDCGISNNDEIAYAAQHGIDVIVVDHHTPPYELPQPAVIINPKVENEHYPFKDISGCAVVFKLVSALRFAQTELYKQEICLLNVRPLNEAYVIEAVKVLNMTEKERLIETIVPGIVTSITQTRLPDFLQGQQIFVWDSAVQKRQLAKIFGSSVEFNFFDVRDEIAKIIPAVENASLLRIKDMSRILRYQENPASELDAFFTIFITFIMAKNSSAHPVFAEQEQKDIQLCMLAALADIMPLHNENRIFIKQGLAAVNKGQARAGLSELLVRQNLIGKKIGSIHLSWNIVPLLNAAGRLGQPELSAKLFLSQDPLERSRLADQIIELNKERRQLGNDAWGIAEKQAYDSLEQYDGKLIVVIDERINRGVSGILAARLVQRFNVPAIAATIVDGETVVGSLRTNRGCNATHMLNRFGELFINHGGHTSAAGFSLKKENLEEFKLSLQAYAPLIELDDDTSEIPAIDAELPASYMKPELLSLIDMMEPYGEKNPPLIFLVKKVRLIAAEVIGKTERQHLKLTFDCGKIKWPAIYWGAAERLNRDFKLRDTVNVIFHIERNCFNGMEIPQMNIIDMEQSDTQEVNK